MVATTQVGSLKRHFRKLKDPRVVKRSRHPLINIITIAICGVIANCDDWYEIEMFAKNRLSWFKRFLNLDAGIPSRDTFRRVFNLLDPRAFSQCCVAWLQAAANLVGVGHIAIDGKTLCGSASDEFRQLHLVSAWATQARIVLGQVAVESKSNEITAIPMLLELLDIKGALVTIDAMGCQKEIAAKIVQRGGDYVLAVKGNQEHLLEDIQTTVQKALDGELPKHQVATHSTTEKGHGREERRTYTVVRALEGIRGRGDWERLTTVGMCLRERTVKGETTMETHYFIGSRRMSARRYAEVLRGHWSIENNLHWQLDITFGEDESQLKDRNGAENFDLLRKLALGLLKENPAKLSMAKKRKQSALDPVFLAETLTRTAKREKI
jgi:predicted transposase YbfD/YdcC